jgi:hypothetical protein
VADGENNPAGLSSQIAAKGVDFSGLLTKSRPLEMLDWIELTSFIRPAETGEDVSAPSVYNPNRSAMR